VTRFLFPAFLASDGRLASVEPAGGQARMSP
jgi:hypothetical protein